MMREELEGPGCCFLVFGFLVIGSDVRGKVPRPIFGLDCVFCLRFSVAINGTDKKNWGVVSPMPVNQSDGIYTVGQVDTFIAGYLYKKLRKLGGTAEGKTGKTGKTGKRDAGHRLLYIKGFCACTLSCLPSSPPFSVVCLMGPGDEL